MSLFSIRSIEAKDIPEACAIYAYYVTLTAVSFEYSAPSETEFLERVRTTTEEFPWLVCMEHERVIGYAYAHKHRLRDAYQWSPESTIYISPDFHTKGIGSILYNTLFEILKAQGYYTVFAGVALPNEKSVGIHQRMGFEEIGIFKNVGYKNGKWHDTRWFQLSLQEPGSHPTVPSKYPAIKESRQVKEMLHNANQQLFKISNS
ncbi:MAG: N-acetyltransferase family protein [Bacteroidota bacterium]